MEDLVKLNLSLPDYELGEDNADFLRLVEFLSTVDSFDKTRTPYTLKKLAGGLGNDIYCLSIGSWKYVLRVFRNGLTIIDREKEVKIQVLLAKHGLASKLMLRFSNGICYRYIEGEALTIDWITSSFDNSLLVAEKMAALHDVESASFGKSKPFLWDKMYESLQSIEEKWPHVFQIERVKAAFGDAAAVRQLIDELRENVEQYAQHPACKLSLCHNDLLFLNMIYNSETGNFCFIDFEHGDINYCAFDIGNFFCEYAGLEPFESIDHNRYPDRAYQLKWLKHYLQHRKLSPAPENVDRLANEFYVVVQKLALASHLFWSLFTLIQVQLVPEGTWDFVGYGILRIKEMKRRKEAFLSLSFSDLN